MKILWIPYQKIVIESRNTPAEIAARLKAHIKTPGSRKKKAFGNNGYFEGKIANDRFQLSRIMRGRNSFLPVINGKVSPAKKGAVIEIKIHIHYLILLLMLALFGYFGYSIVWGFIDEAKNPGITPYLFMAFIYLLCMITFNLEVAKDEKDFRKILA